MIEVGTEINQYQVIEHIGRGGMADVWSARDRRLNRMVAIKTIARGINSDVDPVALFEKEAQTIARMEHPHILPIYDFGDYKGTLYIVMRFVTGGSLDDMLEDGYLSTHETVRIGQSVAAALDHAHQNSVIHLDLKPGNILLDSGGSPYLADFGLATVLDPEGRAQNPGAGTLLYIAPEQLTAEMIDHRADIYSFGIMLFHLLTGELPYEATVPMALKALQGEPDLPNITDYRPDLSPLVNDVLRYTTALYNDQRPSTLLEVIEELQAAVGLSSTGEWSAVNIAPESTMATDAFVDVDDAGLLEAVDLYSRARHIWLGGRGRFLMGMTHFMLMADFYRDAEKHQLSTDEEGLQMLLRGALEHDYDVDYWWSKLDSHNQRWVCLHAIRSENAPARIRALYRLETLPDDEDKPVIPRLVAQALEIETNDDARLAALQVLATRSKLVKPHQVYEVKTEYRGRLLSTITRNALQIIPESVWHETVYSVEIDTLVAEAAMDAENDVVADHGARTIGKMRSLTAVKYVARAQEEGSGQALRAMALIRDEAPSLPDVVSRQARAYAWINNTVRRISENPMDSLLRFALASLGGAIAMGQQIFITFRSEQLFSLQRMGNTIAVGLLFGLFIGVLTLLADQFPSRLRGFWSPIMRLIVSAVLGLTVGIFAWTSYISLFLNYVPGADLMRLAGLGLSFGFIIMVVFQFPVRWRWLSVPITATAIYLPIYFAFRDFWFQDVQMSASRLAILYYDFPRQVFAVGIPFAITIALGGHAQKVYQSLSTWVGHGHEPINRERSGWLSGILIYVMVASALIGVMAMFSAHVDLNLATGWTIWGAITFTFAVAAWQWRLWGMRGLLISAIVAIAGGYWLDVQVIGETILSGDAPGIFEPTARIIWFAWAIVSALMFWGVFKHKLWSAFGLAVMAVAWLIIAFLTDIQASGAVFAATSCGLLVYALTPELKEVRKKKPFNVDTMPIPDDIDITASKLDDDPDLVKTSPQIQQPESNETELDMQEAVKEQWDVPDPLIMSEVQQVKVDSGKVDHYDPDDALKTTDVRQILQQTKDDVSPAPKVKIDTGAVKTEPRTTPRAGNPAPKVKIDTGAVKTEPRTTPRAGSPAPKVKIDTGAVKTEPKRPAKPESQDSPKKPPALNIDTSEIKRDSDDEE